MVDRRNPWDMADNPPNETDRLQEWIQEKTEQMDLSTQGFRVTSISATGEASKYGVVPVDREFPWQHAIGGGTPIVNFQDEGDKAKFVLGYGNYTVQVANLPQDEFGNVASFGDLKKVAEGWYPIWYEDEREIDQEFFFWEKAIALYPYPGFFDSDPPWVEEDARVQELLQWLEEKSTIAWIPVEDHLSSVGERLKSGGAINEWFFQLTDLPPEHEFWQQAIAQFVEENPPDSQLV